MRCWPTPLLALGAGEDTDQQGSVCAHASAGVQTEHPPASEESGLVSGEVLLITETHTAVSVLHAHSRGDGLEETGAEGRQMESAAGDGERSS